MADARRTVDEAMVEHLARLAELELDAERRPAVAEQLDRLLTDANAVNRFMDGRREVGPGVRFHHPDASDDDS
jgi:Asp-tRNA(Asn)/Glu-tRNA(Gln) amidotransferase C subunit